jgi:protocatechuate 3,4-dioxygenase beta subunit
MKHLITCAFILLANIPVSSCAQTQTTKDIKVGDGCEGCEAIYESPTPLDKLEPMFWLPDWNLPGQKLAVNGTVYKADGKTPAEGVIIYIYHTDHTGSLSAKR